MSDIYVFQWPGLTWPMTPWPFSDGTDQQRKTIMKNSTVYYHNCLRHCSVALMSCGVLDHHCIMLRYFVFYGGGTKWWRRLGNSDTMEPITPGWKGHTEHSQTDPAPTPSAITRFYLKKYMQMPDVQRGFTAINDLCQQANKGRPFPSSSTSVEGRESS